ncbi:MAG: NAD-dependent epimerase/dehydratase family protein [Desulfobacteraceae bacterium]|nr:NAD-dependent epimerase/dehydratase family protein [Pseudomonadota bacterium]MCG2758773.1 NAD-dependent epimerase/dehydratase family protein [Desulfobacteraceae bacterium]MCG2830658.1 NAD-dependent epimerase/dehydratase family protein [Desulfobacteraceae bacterium]
MNILVTGANGFIGQALCKRMLESRERRAESGEGRAEQRAESREQRAESGEGRAESRERRGKSG